MFASTSPGSEKTGTKLWTEKTEKSYLFFDLLYAVFVMNQSDTLGRHHDCTIGSIEQDDNIAYTEDRNLVTNSSARVSRLEDKDSKNEI